MSVFFEAEQEIDRFGRSLALRRLGCETMQDWQLAADLQDLQSLISSLQGCEQAYHGRIARQAALGNATAALPQRLLRNMLPPSPNATVKIRHDSPIGYQIIEQRDFDPATMELYTDE